MYITARLRPIVSRDVDTTLNLNTADLHLGEARTPITGINVDIKNFMVVLRA
jgi:hypothetical protein